MFQGKTVLAVIPARGGSKEIPRKNIKKLAGKPLIAWTIEQAKKSRYLDRVILSSEDSEIIKAARGLECEVPFVRPKRLAGDKTPAAKVVLHAISNLPGYDYVVLLQPTSPLRRAEDIDGCIQHCFRSKAKACVSVTIPEKSPYWMYSLDPRGCLYPVLANGRNIERRQGLPKVFALNGAVYVAEVNGLMKSRTFITLQTVAYIMPPSRSVDIDTKLDFKITEFLLAGN